MSAKRGFICFDIACSISKTLNAMPSSTTFCPTTPATKSFLSTFSSRTSANFTRFGLAFAAITSSSSFFLTPRSYRRSVNTSTWRASSSVWVARKRLLPSSGAALISPDDAARAQRSPTTSCTVPRIACSRSAASDTSGSGSRSPGSCPYSVPSR